MDVLGIGVTLASFHSEGNCPVRRLVLKSVVRLLAMARLVLLTSKAWLRLCHVQLLSEHLR